MSWTGYLDSSGADYSAGGLVDTVGSAVRRTTLVISYSYLVTATVDILWAHGGVAVDAGLAIGGTGLLVRGAAVVVEAKAAGSGYFGYLRAGSTDGAIFFQRRAQR